MHKNYYLFKTQTSWLNTQIKNFQIKECFTHQKSELVIKVSLHEEYFLRISIDPSHPYILLSNSRNIKGSKVNLFKELNNQVVDEITIDEVDKIISLKTGQYQLRSIFYGHTPNVILNDLNSNEIARFKKEKRNGSVINSIIGVIPEILQSGELKKIIHQNKELNIIKLLSRFVVGFNFVLARECCFRSKVSFDNKANDLSNSEILSISQNINLLKSELNIPVPRIYFDDGIPKILSIIELKHIAKDFNSKSYQTLNEAWKHFLRQTFEINKIEKITKKSKSILSKKIDFLQSTLDKIQEYEKLEERKTIAEMKGNLLLTFINDIPRGSHSVELKNIFSENNEKIQIKLNPAKSIQENAKKYFEKFKDIEVQKDRIVNRKSVLIKELANLKKMQKQYSYINTEKDALKFQKLMIDKNLIQSSQASELKQENLENAFRKIVLHERWNIFIGKNDRNNDVLTFKFAHKYDLWFHAQGVPGSHTIIRLLNKDEIPPKEIIENVASLAAFHSTAKHSSSVPVNYTQVRYVRRIRNANPGTVSVLQHKTIFVEPKNL